MYSNRIKILKMVVPGDLGKGSDYISSILRFLGAKGVKILGLTTVDANDSNLVGMLLDFGGVNVDVNVFASEVEGKLKSIFECDLKVYFEDYLWSIVGGGSVIFSSSLFKGMFEALFKTLHVVAPNVLYSMGFEMGCRFYDSHVNFVSDDFNLNFKSGSMVFNCLGLGFLELVKVDLELGFLVVRVYDCIECMICSDFREFKGSSFVLGFLEGWFSRLLKRSLYGREIKCILRGGEYCEFDFQSIYIYGDIGYGVSSVDYNDYVDLLFYGGYGILILDLWV